MSLHIKQAPSAALSTLRTQLKHVRLVKQGQSRVESSRVEYRQPSRRNYAAWQSGQFSSRLNRNIFPAGDVHSSTPPLLPFASIRPVDELENLLCDRHPLARAYDVCTNVTFTIFHRLFRAVDLEIMQISRRPGLRAPIDPSRSIRSPPSSSRYEASSPRSIQPLSLDNFHSPPSLPILLSLVVFNFTFRFPIYT